jgi:four helix bundle protein
MQDFRKLRAWHLANDISLRVVAAFPPGSASVVPGLRSQVIRAAMSIAANLAEGAGRATRTEFLHFVEISSASRHELDSHLRVARDVGALPHELHATLKHDLDLLHRMLISLMRTLQRRIAEDEDATRNASP